MFSLQKYLQNKKSPSHFFYFAKAILIKVLLSIIVIVGIYNHISNTSNSSIVLMCQINTPLIYTKTP